MFFNRKNTNSPLTIILTGAYGGIGKELAKNLCQRGANLILLGRDEWRLNELQAEIKRNATQDQMICSYCVDLAIKSEISAFTKKLQRITPKANVLVNNAGVNHFGLFTNTSDEALETLFDVNVLAPMRLTKAMLPQLKSQSWARVVNVGSVFGALGYPGFSAYASSKFALRGFSESLARELSDSNVRVGHFTAHATNTPLNNAAMNGLNHALNTSVDSPKRVAMKLADFICSNASSASMGWPEKIFVRLNVMAPKMVSQSINKHLPLIKRFAQS